MTTDPNDVLLVLRPVADPAAAHGIPTRSADYRLKLALKVLLRSFGLKCVEVRDHQPETGRPKQVGIAG